MLNNKPERLLKGNSGMPSDLRNASVDSVRLAALVGICVVNLPYLGLPYGEQSQAPLTAFDMSAALVIHALFEAKFFLLFSFLFGWGMHIQDLSAARAGASFAGRYLRRIGGLAVFGVMHALLVFTGDILLLYAILGLLIFPLRRSPVTTLIKIAASMIPLALVFLLVLASLPLDDMTVVPPEPGLGGSYMQTVMARLQTWPGDLFFLLLFQGPLVFGAFALGLAAARADFFHPASVGRSRLKKAVPLLLATGLPLNLAYAQSMLHLEFGGTDFLTLAAFISIAIAAPLLSACYLFLLLELSDRTLLPKLLRDAGQNSLTVYILQGILAGLIFGGYGLGLYGSLTYSTLLPLAILNATVAILLTGLLVRLLGRGPFELALRTITYGAKQIHKPAKDS